MKRALYRPHPDFVEVVRQGWDTTYGDAPPRVQSALRHVREMTCSVTALVSDGPRDQAAVALAAAWLKYDGPTIEDRPRYAAGTWKFVGDEEAEK